MKFASHIIVQRPVSDIAGRLADPDHPLAWQQDLVSITRLDGVPGAPGSTALYSYDDKGRSFELTETIESVSQAGTTAVYEAPNLRHTITTTFTADGPASTVMTVENDLRLSGPAKLAGPLLAKSLRAQADAKLAGFKAWVEAPVG
ncbi:MAG: SRPBCC family protein [Mycetocola sp.]